MNMDGMMMDGGPMMQGTWYHPRTGDKFTVADCFLEDMQMRIRTTDGRMLSYDVIKDYIQGEKDMVITKEAAQLDTSPINKNALLAGLDEFAQTDLSSNALNMPISALTHGDVTNSRELPTNTSKINNETLNIIKRAFKKVNSPKVEVKVQFDPFPEQEVTMLVNILEVSKEDIAQYVWEEYVAGGVLDESIKEQIATMFGCVGEE
jgi:hypothetical protein